MSKTDKPYYETKTFRAISTAALGVGAVCMAGQKTKKFVVDHPRMTAAAATVAAAGVYALAFKKLDDQFKSFPTQN